MVSLDLPSYSSTDSVPFSNPDVKTLVTLSLENRVQCEGRLNAKLHRWCEPLDLHKVGFQLMTNTFRAHKTSRQRVVAELTKFTAFGSQRQFFGGSYHRRFLRPFSLERDKLNKQWTECGFTDKLVVGKGVESPRLGGAGCFCGWVPAGGFAEGFFS